MGRAPEPACGLGVEQAVIPSRGVKLVRDAGREQAGAAEPEISVLRHRKLWLPPLMTEIVLCLGACWLALSLEHAIWLPGEKFPVLSFVVLALLSAALAGHARLNELFMPRSVVLFGVGSLVLATLGVGAYLIVEAFYVGGLYRLRYMPYVLVPIGLFLIRSYFVFRAARSAPSLSKWRLSAKPGGDRMRAWRARLRYWLKS